MNDDAEWIHSVDLEKAFSDLSDLLNALLGKARLSAETEDNWQIFFTMAIHRISYYFWQHQVKLLAHIFSEHTQLKNCVSIGCDI